VAGLNVAVLVLNQNYEPLDVCTWRRAMVMIVAGKAEIVENGRGVIRTPSTTFPLPSVVRLRYLIRRPRPRVKLNRREIFRRDDYTCQYCGKRTSNLTVDHVVPRHRGGTYSWENLVSACPQCNRRKGGKTVREVGDGCHVGGGWPRASCAWGTAIPLALFSSVAPLSTGLEDRKGDPAG